MSGFGKRRKPDSQKTRFKGEKGEQATFFIQDPSGNVLEFKTFKNDSMILKH